MAKNKRATKDKTAKTGTTSSSRTKKAKHDTSKKTGTTITSGNSKNSGGIGGSSTKKQQPQVSVCDIMKENTSKIIQKAESQIPVTVQLYSDLYRDFLHSLDDIFGVCYVSEKRFIDSLGLDNATVQSIDKSWEIFADIAGTQIDAFNQISRAHAEWLKTMTNFYDKLIHAGMDYYAKTLDTYTESVR